MENMTYGSSLGGKVEDLAIEFGASGVWCAAPAGGERAPPAKKDVCAVATKLVSFDL